MLLLLVDLYFQQLVGVLRKSRTSKECAVYQMDTAPLVVALAPRILNYATAIFVCSVSGKQSSDYIISGTGSSDEGFLANNAVLQCKYKPNK